MCVCVAWFLPCHAECKHDDDRLDQSKTINTNVTDVAGCVDASDVITLGCATVLTYRELVPIFVAEASLLLTVTSTLKVAAVREWQ